MDYSIRICMIPNYKEHAEAPYYWCVMYWVEEQDLWYTDGYLGWEKTPDEAYRKAKECYEKIQEGYHG